MGHYMMSKEEPVKTLISVSKDVDIEIDISKGLEPEQFFTIIKKGAATIDEKDRTPQRCRSL